MDAKVESSPYGDYENYLTLFLSSSHGTMLLPIKNESPDTAFQRRIPSQFQQFADELYHDDSIDSESYRKPFDIPEEYETREWPEFIKSYLEAAKIVEEGRVLDENIKNGNYQLPDPDEIYRNL